jgi:hypothetical protein
MTDGGQIDKLSIFGSEDRLECKGGTSDSDTDGGGEHVSLQDNYNSLNKTRDISFIYISLTSNEFCNV